jgi:hypothetical protein
MTNLYGIKPTIKDCVFSQYESMADVTKRIEKTGGCYPLAIWSLSLCCLIMAIVLVSLCCKGPELSFSAF